MALISRRCHLHLRIVHKNFKNISFLDKLSTGPLEFRYFYTIFVCISWNHQVYQWLELYYWIFRPIFASIALLSSKTHYLMPLIIIMWKELEDLTVFKFPIICWCGDVEDISIYDLTLIVNTYVVSCAEYEMMMTTVFQCVSMEDIIIH